MMDQTVNERRDMFAQRLAEAANRRQVNIKTIDWREEETQDASQLILESDSKRETFPISNIDLLTKPLDEMNEQIEEILDSFLL